MRLSGPFRPGAILPFALLACVHAQITLTAHERALLDLTNQTRVEHHLAPLVFDPSLTRAARLHVAWVLGGAGPLEHQYAGEPDLITRARGAGAHFETIAENLGSHAESPMQLQAIWMSTPLHRANILDPHLTAIGVGVVEHAGLLYAVEDFARSVPVLTRDDVEHNLAQLLLTHGIPSAITTEDARRTCEQNSTSAADARLVVQWEASDLSKLPDALLDRMTVTRYRSAAVGACPGRNLANHGFTTFHVAVLLY